MIKLDNALQAWGTPSFESAFKRELAILDASHLPLQQALSSGSHVTDAPVSATINSVTEMPHIIRIRAGVFFQSIIGGCSCADDPTPVSEINEYCEMQFDIDKETAETRVTILD